MLSPFARVTKNNEPFLGLLLTCFIAWLAILLGAVDAIAEVLDFFFLMCYAFVNLICALHSLLGAPNWRPRFKYYHWSLSLMGAGLCFFIMFASHWLYALIAIGLTLLIYKYVEWKGAKKEWGDGFRGLALTTAQYSLLKVEDKDLHPKNWRPQLLILIDGKYSKEIIDLRSVNLLNLAGQLKAGRGLAIVVAFIKSSTPNEDRKRSDEIKERIQQDMTNSRLRGFGKALFYLDFQIEGCVSALYQSVGIGGLRPNTVLLNFPKNSENEAEHIIFAEQLLKGVQNENCVIICKGITDFPLAVERLIGFIDIWWILNDGGILMLIAYLLHQHKVWKGCKLRIFVIAEEREEEENDRLKLRLQRYIYNLRIDASVFIVNMVDPDVTDDAVQRTFQMEQKNIRLRTQLSNGCLNYAFAVDDTILQNGDTNSSRISKATTATHESSFIRHTLHTLESDSASNITPNGDIDVEKLDSFKIEKMKAAILLNRVILEYSTSSQLVLMSLPSPPKTTRALLENYIAYVEALTEDLPRVMLIGGTGKEVITVAS
uniref:Uncharacterized protein n=1 Tax=Acrobeloides nanus TaxID=290746 RepID=A0A914E5Q1_9BILA